MASSAGNFSDFGRIFPHSELLTVHKSGPGVPAEAQEKIFERFFRLDLVRTQNRGALETAETPAPGTTGAGLGLAIALDRRSKSGPACTCALGCFREHVCGISARKWRRRSQIDGRYAPRERIHKLNSREHRTRQIFRFRDIRRVDPPCVPSVLIVGLSWILHPNMQYSL